MDEQHRKLYDTIFSNIEAFESVQTSLKALPDKVAEAVRKAIEEFVEAQNNNISTILSNLESVIPDEYFDGSSIEEKKETDKPEIIDENKDVTLESVIDALDEISPTAIDEEDAEEIDEKSDWGCILNFIEAELHKAVGCVTSGDLVLVAANKGYKVGSAHSLAAKMKASGRFMSFPPRGWMVKTGRAASAAGSRR